MNIHVMDAPFRLGTGDHIKDMTFVGTGSTYGRFLFNKPSLVIADGKDITVERCTFLTKHWDMGCTWRDRLRIEWVMFKSELAFWRQFPPDVLWLILRLKLRRK